jgi:uncharacterized protein YcfJ
MVGRKLVAAVAAAALGCAGCAGNLRHTTQLHPSNHENWAAVMRLRTGTFLRVEERSGAWTIGHLVAKEPQGITVDNEIVHRVLPRSQIRQIVMEHHHGDWRGIKDVAIGALAGGLIGGLAVPKHRAIAATILAAVGAWNGLVLAVMTMLLKEGADTSSQDEILVYYAR